MLYKPLKVINEPVTANSLGPKSRRATNLPKRGQPSRRNSDQRVKQYSTPRGEGNEEGRQEFLIKKEYVGTPRPKSGVKQWVI